ncbi:S1/P1 nuclease [Hymenobacter persicinus]|uniref:S1/P1 Nuclease n=1 Tax=Hymenobacter persicinus TaxID=2025506 RepID=A0A4Q5LAJ8_9BACT|nr:S1/P1 nuclease [Hymenobacter persicinus]RYU78154.1 S1/P1 Nuclease [Hymenobacter persicinus]
MLLVKKCAFLLVLLALPFSLRAWGVQGHRVVGKIAENHLSDNARKQVALLLGTQRLPLATTWADEARYSPEYSFTAPWHFINTPSGMSFEQYNTAINAMTEPNAYQALQQNLKDLKDLTKTREQRQVALKFVIHIIGDVHQPMHVSRAEDKGGNAITVKYQGKDTNLHSLWDSGLIEYEGMTYSELAALLDHASSAQVKQWQKDAVPTWLFESYTISQQLYAETALNPDFDYKYVPAHLPSVEDRLVQAGIRLAGVLNAAF